MPAMVSAEVIEAAIPILDRLLRTQFSLTWERLPFSADHYSRRKRLCPTPRSASAEEVDAIFLGALGDPRVRATSSARHPARPEVKLDLYVNFVRYSCCIPTSRRCANRVDRLRHFPREYRGQYLGRGRSSGDEHVAEE